MHRKYKCTTISLSTRILTKSTCQASLVVQYIKIFWAWPTVKSIIRWFRYLRANKDASSLWRANLSCKTAWNWVEIHIWIYSGTEGEKLWQSRQSKNVLRHNFTFLRMKAGRKCGKAELQVFGNQGSVEMRKRNFTCLKDQAEMSCADLCE